LSKVAVFLSVEVKQGFQRTNLELFLPVKRPTQTQDELGTDFSKPIAQPRYASDKKVSRQKDGKA
jgi:hypothetical protein